MSNAFPSFISSFFSTIGDILPAVLRSVGAGEKGAESDVSLVLFEDTLINTATGEHRRLTESSKHYEDSQMLAEAASALLSSREGAAKVLLLLPSTEFVASSYDMAIKGEKLLKSALQLQAHTLIPAFEDELLLGVNGASSKGVALWLPAQQAESLFQAFKQKGLFLAAIMPRTLSLGETATTEEGLVIRDNDAQSCIQLELNENCLKSFSSVNRVDLEQPAFAEQWAGASSIMAANKIIEYSTLEQWLELKQKISGLAAYCFLPSGAGKAVKKASSAIRIKRIGQFALGGIVLLSLPFVSLWVQTMLLESSLEDAQLASAEARRLQASIFEMEDEWGPLYDFPDQDIAEILLSLSDVDGLGGSLVSFSVDRGEIEIEGEAQDPAYLVELLAEKEEFYAIGQSRSISGGNNDPDGDRFGIRMSLSEVDFAAYEEKYPMEEQ